MDYVKAVRELRKGPKLSDNMIRDYLEVVLSNPSPDDRESEFGYGLRAMLSLKKEEPRRKLLEQMAVNFA